jgi:hypothetical protein
MRNMQLFLRGSWPAAFYRMTGQPFGPFWLATTSPRESRLRRPGMPNTSERLSSKNLALALVALLQGEPELLHEIARRRQLLVGHHEDWG